DLTPTADGRTEVRVWAEMTPRYSFWSPPVEYVVGPQALDGVIAQCKLFEQFLNGEIEDPFPQLQTRHDALRFVPAPGRSLLLRFGIGLPRAMKAKTAPGDAAGTTESPGADEPA